MPNPKFKVGDLVMEIMKDGRGLSSGGVLEVDGIMEAPQQDYWYRDYAYTFKNDKWALGRLIIPEKFLRLAKDEEWDQERI